MAGTEPVPGCEQGRVIRSGGLAQENAVPEEIALAGCAGIEVVRRSGDRKDSGNVGGFNREWELSGENFRLALLRFTVSIVFI
jgi:hypothetical protein